MGATVNTVLLYLTARKGPRSDYNLMLSIYPSEASSGGVPASDYPLSLTFRSVDDIDRTGWYAFTFDPEIILVAGTYSLVLQLVSLDQNNPVDFNHSYVGWIHDHNTQEPRNVYAFSNDPLFSTDYGVGGSYGFSVYGYGYGYDDDQADDTLDFFNILGFAGDDTGYGIDDDTEAEYGYSYGFESGTFLISNTISRNYKICDQFNVYEVDEDNNEFTITLPVSQSTNLELNNRQDFVCAQNENITIVGNSIALANYGERIYFVDTTKLTKSSSSAVEPVVHEANLFLSVNTLNYADIISPAENTNPYKVWLVAAPSHSGVFMSTDGAASWQDVTGDLITTSGARRNISCLKFIDEETIVAFDNTNDSDRGNVYLGLIDNSDTLTVSWSLASIALNSKTVRDALVTGTDNIWAGTDSGVYYSSNGGTSWVARNSGFISTPDVNVLRTYTVHGLSFGYGYGGGLEIDFFDVLGIDGTTIGYGFDSFESDYAGEYGYGFGYEYVYGDDYEPAVYCGSDIGLYVWNGTSWETTYTAEEVFSIGLSLNAIYIGLNDRILRSDDGGVSFSGTTPFTTNFFASGLTRSQVTDISVNSEDESQIYATQIGGLQWSRNAGGTFRNISKKMLEKRFTKILQNPVNGNIIYTLSESTKFGSAGMTILIDQSGSMFGADSADNRITAAQKLVNVISESAAYTPYFQIIATGLSETEFLKNINACATNTSYEFGGIFNLTEGFTSDTDAIMTILEDLRSDSSHKRAAIFDAIDIVSRGLLQNGSAWDYDEKTCKYTFTDITSDFFNDLDKSFVIFTDGIDTSQYVIGGKTLQGKTASQITTAGSAFCDIKYPIYIVSVGGDIDYKSLETLQNSNDNCSIYHSIFTTSIYSSESGDSLDNHSFSTGTDSIVDVADILLERERYRTRTGQWKRIIDLEEKVKIQSIEIDANVPNNTTIDITARVSDDKKNWSMKIISSNYLDEISIDLNGRYIELTLDLESTLTTVSPEIREITINYLSPSHSYIFFSEKEIDEGDRMSEVHVASIDSQTEEDVDSDEVIRSFGIGQTKSSDFSLFNNIRENLRSVLVKRELEDMNTVDYVIFTASNGSWPGDASVSVFEVGSEENTLISEYTYTSIPELGTIVFVNKVDSNKKIAITLEYDNVYRISAEITNRIENETNFTFHDISWTFKKEGTTESEREALPKVSSQLGSDDTYGFVTPPNIPTSSALSTTISAQYLLQDGHSGGIIAATTGEILDITTEDDEEILRYYSQNAGFKSFNITRSGNDSYCTISTLSQSDLSVVEDEDLETSQSLSIPNNGNILSGTSLTYIFGSKSGGGAGLPTSIRQDNLLFDPEDLVSCEWRTYVIIGDTNSIDTDVSFANVIDDNGFDKKLTPTVNLCGSTATGIVIFAPTNVGVGLPFTITVLAVDDQGFIDRDFVGTVSLSLSNTSFGSIADETLSFTSSDLGVKTATGSVSANASGFAKVVGSIVGGSSQFKSNPMVIDGRSIVRWGDLNISTIFSEGRQSIDFAADYAANISSLDFIAISDDIESLDAQEWTYIREKSDELSTGGLFVFPGFRHRSKNYYGERVVMFRDKTTSPETLITKPVSTDGTYTQQIKTLHSELKGYEYITIPIHSPYENTTTGHRNSRGLSFENYQFISLILTTGSDATNFLHEREVSVEVFSEHGYTESESFYRNQEFITEQDKYYFPYALRSGKRFGFVASSGGYSTRPGYYRGDLSSKVVDRPSGMNHIKGITAAISPQSNRNSIFNAVSNRRTYASTGARAYIEFWISYGTNAVDMGGVISTTDDETDVIINYRTISDGNANISRITLIKIKTGSVSEEISLSTTGVGEDSGQKTYTDTIGAPANNDEYCYYLRVEQSDGHILLGSPVWLNFGRTLGIQAL